MTAVVAEREIGSSNVGAAALGRVSFEMPQPDDRSWRCDYSISLAGNDVRRGAFGVDSLQALQLAINSAVVELAISDAFKAGQLTVLGEPIATLDDLKKSFGLSRLPGFDA